MTDYVLIGAGVAAISAAEAIRSVDANGKLTILCDDPHGFYSRPGLAYALTGELDENHLFPYRQADYQKLNLTFVRGRARRILPDLRQVEVEGHGTIPYHRLLIATGAESTPLATPGAELQGVVKLDHLEDARNILAQAKKARAAVVVGGGITALELAEGLASRRLKVHYLLRGERYWGNVLDETESRIIEKRLGDHHIQIHFNSEIGEIVPKNGRVGGVITRAGQKIACEMLAYAVGVAPRVELARQAGLSCERGVLVNEFLETSHPGIYAAGDVAQAFNPASGKHVLDSLWSPAREQGTTAGLNMAGVRKKYGRLPVFNVTRLAGLTTTIIGAVGGGRDEDLAGIARGDSETWRDLPDAIIAQGGFDVNRLRLMVGHHTLLGAVVMGDQKLSSALQAIIREQIDISSIRARLLEKNAALADIIAHFWHEHGAQRT